MQIWNKTSISCRSAERETTDRFTNSVVFLVLTSPIKYAEKLSVAFLNAEPGKSPNNVVNDLIDFNKHENLNYRIRVSCY